ncbi:RNA polymerase sigma factor SigF [Neosynechococcus sphagnicola sy1]|uniref:RNA polymerase sigma factor SigF n=1 Tax=Neosynechococcus sphagnicola sy1 TaxID=1497020 RepID=A0A098TIR8_9CYAN|nr:RNA polymerase sigma factor SigF [Neosynechococcus sphagnicola]KGF71931.1 RNA polymerase sigma factor SigF [Neosynechococcus sphagnicola sy1]
MSTPITSDLKNESLQLLRDYQRTQSAEIRNRLVELNLGLVRKEVHHWVHQCTENYDDLLQVGSIGLIRAIERFEMAKGHAFSSFAVPYIRGEIQHYLRDKSPSLRIPRRWLTLQRQAVQVMRTLQTDLGRHPNDIEIATALEISLAEWQEVKLAGRNRVPLSLDAPVRDDEVGATFLGDLVPDTQYRSFQLSQEDQIRLRQALVQLEQKTCEILEFVFLQDLTQKETAELLGVSAVTVSRRVKKGLESLRKLIAGND